LPHPAGRARRSGTLPQARRAAGHRAALPAVRRQPAGTRVGAGDGVRRGPSHHGGPLRRGDRRLRRAGRRGDRTVRGGAGRHRRTVTGAAAARRVRAVPPTDPSERISMLHAPTPSPLLETIAAIRPADAEAAAEARAHQDRLTKPRGSLGVLEEVAVRLAGAAAVSPAPIPEPAALAIFAADHGVHARGVSP